MVNKWKTIQIHMGVKLYMDIQAAAKEESLFISAYCRQIVNKEIKKRRKKVNPKAELTQ